MLIAFGENYDPLSRFEVPSTYNGRHGLSLQGIFQLSMRVLFILVLSAFAYSAYLAEHIPGMLLCLVPIVYLLYLLALDPLNIRIESDHFVLRAGFGLWTRRISYQEVVSVSLISTKERQEIYGNRRQIGFAHLFSQPKNFCKVYVSDTWLRFPLDNFKQQGFMLKAIVDRSELNFSGGAMKNASYDKEAIHAA